MVYCHDNELAGHYGIFKTHDIVTRTFHWPGMRNFIKKYVLSCEVCQRNKVARHKKYGLLKSLSIPDHPWTSISMDMITQLPLANNHDAILVIVDRFTKMGHFIATQSNITSKEVMQLLFDNIISKHGIPRDITTDRASIFTSNYMKAICKGLHISQNLSTAYHPQTDGQTERLNAILEQYLRCYVNYNQDNWNEYLTMAEFSYNNSAQVSINDSPFYALYGYHPNMDNDIPQLAKNIPLAEVRLQHLHQIQEDLKFFIESAQGTQAKYYNRKTKEMHFEVGQQVWLDNRNIKTSRPSRKLDNRRIGPFTILEKIGTHAYKLDLPASMNKVHPVFHISLLEPVIETSIDNREVIVPHQIEIKDDDQFEVEQVVNVRRQNNQLQFLLHWKGYGIEDRSWEPFVEISCRRLISEFYLKHPDEEGREEFRTRYPNDHGLLELDPKEGGTVTISPQRGTVRRSRAQPMSHKKI
jgi:transposase InsO family protein